MKPYGSSQGKVKKGATKKKTGGQAIKSTTGGGKVSSYMPTVRKKKRGG